MGVADFLKKIFPPGKNPLLAMEPQCVRHALLTLRLPAGWQFTGQSNSRVFQASGPGGAAAEFLIATAFTRRVDATNVEENRTHFAKTMREFVFKGRTPAEKTLSSGILWMEARDVQGGNERLQIALFNPQPRDPEQAGQPAMLQATCTIPRASADERSDRFEALRAALRAAAWN